MQRKLLLQSQMQVVTNPYREDDGTAIVTLDGRNTEDPQERIETWSWVDDTGKEIANTAAVRVKLNRGNHRLELRIKDRDGRWSSDSIDVRIE